VTPLRGVTLPWKRVASPFRPELNPDERLNAGFKHALGTRVALLTQAKLQVATEQHMLSLEKQPERVRAYFGDPYVKYAA